MKKLLIVIAVILLVAMGTVGASAAYANFIAMPNPIVEIGDTIGKKYKFETNFKADKLLEEGKFLAEVDFAEENIADLPAGKIGLSASYAKGGNIGIQANVYEEQGNVYLSKEDLAIAAKVKGFDGGKAYGASVKNFREKLEDSVFGPESESDYALPEEAFEILCTSVETLTDLLENTEKEGKDAKQNEKDIKTLQKFIAKTFKKTEFADAEKSYKGIEILGEKRSVRTKTYTLDQDVLENFLDTFADEMKNADGKVEEAADRLLDKINESLGNVTGMLDESLGFEIPEIDWDWLQENLEEIKDEIDIGDFELVITVAYKGTNISAVIIDIESDDLKIEGTLTIDFGKKPVKTMDTVIDLNAKIMGQKVKGNITITDNSEKNTNDLTITGKIDLGDDEAYAVKARLLLDGQAGKASLKVEFSDEGKFKNMEPVLNLQLGYVDEKDQLALTFKSLTLFEDETVKAEDIGMKIKLAVYTDADDITAMPSYTDVLSWKTNEDVEEFVEKFDEFRRELTEKYEADFSKEEEPAPEEDGDDTIGEPEDDGDDAIGEPEDDNSDSAEDAEPSGTAPNTNDGSLLDPADAVAALEANGYQAGQYPYEDEISGTTYMVSGLKVENGLEQSVTVYYYKDIASAQADYDSYMSIFDAIADGREDYKIAINGNAVYMGTQAAVNAAMQ